VTAGNQQRRAPPIRIGLMLRSLDERGGIGVYTRYLTQELLARDRRNHYCLFYRSPSNLGRFSDRDNVTERVVRAPNVFLWDQAAIPYACWREKVDIVFHPKFTVPLLAPAKTGMVLHGADWLIPEQARFYPALNVAFMRLLLPIYCRRATVLVSVSKLTTQNLHRALSLPPDKVHTVYFGPARHFRRVKDAARVRQVKERYDLPERFILTLSKPGGDGRKNMGTIFEAYRRYHGKTPHKLVVGGRDCEAFRESYGLPFDGYGGDVTFPGWIDQEDLPAVYTLADLFLYPSNLEAFPIPVTEAMACGTPIVTSDANGLREIAGDAALLVDPADAEAICRGIGRVLSEPGLRERLVARGLARSKRFSWDRCARETLDILESLAR